MFPPQKTEYPHPLPETNLFHPWKMVGLEVGRSRFPFLFGDLFFQRLLLFVSYAYFSPQSQACIPEKHGRLVREHSQLLLGPLYCWWFRTPAISTFWMYKPCKSWDELPYQLVSRISSNQQYGFIFVVVALEMLPFQFPRIGPMAISDTGWAGHLQSPVIRSFNIGKPY